MKSSSKLCIPEDVLKQHAAILGKTGKGKSSLLRYLVEHLLREKKRVCIIDPKGDWWGLKSSADGKGPGFPVIAFGNFKGGRAGDVPINEHSGKHVAELIASGNRPCVIGFSGWPQGQMIRFWIEFAQALFNANSGELFLVGDEFHNFAPKGKIMDPDAGRCLHWSNRILSEGRGLGLICLIASQRPQKVHNDTLTCCETLFAMGVNHPADRAAVKDWIDGCGDRERGTVVLNELASLQRGEAYVWSPEIKFGPELVKFPMFETFDSFAAPQAQPKVNEQGWASVNLAEVKERLASVIEEAKANDPKELRREIAELKKQLKAVPLPAPAETEIKEVPVLTNEQVMTLAGLSSHLAKVETACEAVMEHAREKLKEFQGIYDVMQRLHGREQVAAGRRPALRPETRPAPAAVANLKRSSSNLRQTNADSNADMDGARQKILDTVRMLNDRGLVANREMIARWLDIHPNGGRYGSNLAWLREQGFLDGCELTGKGRGAVNASHTGLEAIRSVVDGAQWQIIERLKDGETCDREALAGILGIHPNGGRYGSNLARLRTMGLIPERGTIKLTEAAYA